MSLGEALNHFYADLRGASGYVLSHEGERVQRQFPTRRYSCLSTMSFFNSAIAFAGLSPFGQALVQFMIVWQR
jgi:hypothetical protein